MTRTKKSPSLYVKAIYGPTGRSKTATIKNTRPGRLIRFVLVAASFGLDDAESLIRAEAKRRASST